MASNKNTLAIISGVGLRLPQANNLDVININEFINMLNE